MPEIPEHLLKRKGKPVLIGQAPSQFTQELNGGRPFSGWSGQHLARLVGMSLESFLGKIEARNLLDSWPGSAGGKGDDFPTELAKESAEEMRPGLSGRVVVLAGRKVAEAFGFDSFAWLSERIDGGTKFYFLPHPSGINAWYNKSWHRREAAELLKRLILEGS